MKFLIRQSGLDDQSFNKLLLLMLHSFFLGMFISIYLSIANAEFVSVFGREYLPFGYLLSGIIGYLTVQGYGRLLRKSGYRAFLGGLLFLLSATLLFRGILLFTDHGSIKVMSFIIFLFVMPFVSVSGLAQTGLLIKTFGFADTKKFAGIVNSGGTIASIIGYLSVPALIPFLSSPFDLFYVCIFAIAVAIFLLTRINKNILLMNPETNSNVGGKKEQTTIGALLKQPYIRYIAICGAISMMAFYFIDYSFLINAKSVTDSPSELASIIGGFFGIIKAAELVLSLFSGRIFRSFGLKTGIVILPLLCVLFSTAAIVTFYVADSFAFVVVIFMLKFFERMVSKAIEDPANKNLYQLLPPEDRLAIQAKIDGGTKQLSIIVASVILMVYSKYMPESYSKIGLVYISIPLFVLWVFSSRQLVQSFRQRLRDMLNPPDTSVLKRVGNPIDKLKSALTDVQSHRVKKTSLQSLLAYKLQIPIPETQKVNEVEEVADVRDSYVPSHALKHLVPTPGYSRLEVQLFNPLLVIPPPVIQHLKKEVKSLEWLDEKEITRLLLSGNDPGAELIRDAGKKLDEVKTEHEKKMILNLVSLSKTEAATSVLLNHLEFPDYYIKRQAYAVLENRNYKCSIAEELNFRNVLEHNFHDVTFVISLLAAIPRTNEFSDLRKALAEEEDLLKNRILSVLTWKYDKASINIIRETIFSEQEDQRNMNNVLALELIDNLIDRELKPKIMPVFENDRYVWRLNALNTWYHFPILTTEEALIKILHCDYTKMSTWAKACALKRMIDEQNFVYKKIIAGYIQHPNAFLRSLAMEYREVKNERTIYPLHPAKYDTFRAEKVFALPVSGMELYKLVNLMKENSFFSKVSCNDLIRLVCTIELRKSPTEEIAGNSNPMNKPYFISAGNVVIEYKGVFPAEIFRQNYISPDMFDRNCINKILIHSSMPVYEISASQLANLAITSDAFFNDMDEKDLVVA